MTNSATETIDFDWKPQPAAAELIRRTMDAFCENSPLTRQLRERLLSETGTRLVDWIDHLALPQLPESQSQLQAMGFEAETLGGVVVLRHGGGMFPQIVVQEDHPPRLAIKVESVVDFLAAQGIADASRIQGGPLSRLRSAVLEQGADGELCAVERHGYRGFEIQDLPPEQLRAAMHHSEAFRLRCREWETDAAAFTHASELIDAAKRDLPVDQTCDLFFEAERHYWQRRNRAGRMQKARQDALGLGWANHDHHTYRSSRQQFANLIEVLEQLGFQCRERFYGGRDAGWGAQVLEQPNCGLVIFADVDLAPEEVTGDFAHQGLDPRDQLGTVGLWCKLHGEAFLSAGMHHLECQFDFSAACRQLASAGVRTMSPFTDFPFLKQAFTEGEIWPVRGERIDTAVRDGNITAEQAERFRANGSIGSHLEILERNDGYRGFNQTGISEIIRETDPRHQTTGEL